MLEVEQEANRRNAEVVLHFLGKVCNYQKYRSLLERYRRNNVEYDDYFRREMRTTKQRVRFKSPCGKCSLCQGTDWRTFGIEELKSLSVGSVVEHTTLGRGWVEADAKGKHIRFSRGGRVSIKRYCKYLTEPIKVVTFPGDL